MRIFENRMLRRIFEPNRNEVRGNGKNYIMRCLMICTPHPTFSGDYFEKNEISGTCGTNGELERSIQGFGGKT